MFEKHISCPLCGNKYPLKSLIFRCRKCGSTLEVAFDYSRLKKILTKEKLSSRPFLHSRYLELYPVKNLFSLQEGGTALLRSRNLEKELGLKFRLYFKYEGTNPTGSFKDRGSSVEVAKAVEFRAEKTVCASTGNMGASVAAYSGLAGLKCSIFTPKDTASTKMEQILAYGANVYHTSGDYTQAMGLAEEIFREGKAYLLGDYLYRREGTKSIGFEICETLSPDYVFCPVGNGTLITATWKAFREFKILGLAKRLPRMAGIQAETCSPIVKAFREESPIRAVKNPHTVAVAIECGDPIDGKGVIRAIRDSKGFAEGVSDSEILKARELLAKREGLFAEPGGAAAFAGILKSKEKIESGSRVVCLVTGHGLKSPRTGVKGKPIDVSEKEGVKRFFR
ncbi:MAG: threonine synthase [Candidatus Aenigmarchaeota archaeon]|nr:threonine synthase [Candidatus Aenigmarchaeota archaeon]